MIGASRLSFNFSIVSLSSLRSSFVPTKIMGTLLQWCLTSGYHLALTFSKEAGLTREKQMRKTSCNSNSDNRYQFQFQVNSIVK